MIDLSKIDYRCVVIDENSNQYNIEDYIYSLGWEENKNELSVRLSFTAKNDETAKGKLSSLIKPGCLVGIFAADGNCHDEEVARGFVVDWNPSLQNSSDGLKCTAYDNLYALQKSQDNRFYPSGTGTQSIITGLFEDFEIPSNGYSGPNVSHGKLKYNSSYVSDIIRDVLDDAKKKGAGTYLLRSAKGYSDVVARGSNTDVYVFTLENTKSISSSMSTAELVTRVRVIGQEDDDGNSSVEATLNGLTQFGIRQKIYSRGSSDESLDEAKTAAQEILDDKGSPDEQITLSAPDVPYIRKGDLVYVMAGVSDNYYYVNGIRHDCETYSMTMELELAKTETVKENQTESKKEYKVGDIVNYHGGTHYVSSYSDSKGYKAKPGKAKITLDPNCRKNGKAHPWHLIHIDSSSNVYGWVDEGTFD